MALGTQAWTTATRTVDTFENCNFPKAICSFLQASHVLSCCVSANISLSRLIFSIHSKGHTKTSEPVALSSSAGFPMPSTSQPIFRMHWLHSWSEKCLSQPFPQKKNQAPHGGFHLEIPKNGGFIRENPMEMDDLGVPPFMEPPTCFFWFFWISNKCLIKTTMLSVCVCVFLPKPNPGNRKLQIYTNLATGWSNVQMFLLPFLHQRHHQPLVAASDRAGPKSFWSHPFLSRGAPTRKSLSEGALATVPNWLLEAESTESTESTDSTGQRKNPRCRKSPYDWAFK